MKFGVSTQLLAAGDDGLFHVSFDLDGVDPEYAPGVGTPVPGGLSDDGFDEVAFVREHSTPGLVLSLKHYYVAALTGVALAGLSTTVFPVATA